MALCNRCQDGINDDNGQRCEYCDGTGYVQDDEYNGWEEPDPYDDIEFTTCSDCDNPDACSDFGCAIEMGIRKRPDGVF